MVSPFTFTPGMAGDAYIDMHYADEIIQNFKSKKSEKYVYKILGLRGSGKSVIYSKVINAIKEEKDWLVYTLSTGGDPISILLGMMSKESFINDYEKSVSIRTEGSVEGNLVAIKGSGTMATEVSLSQNSNYFSAEASLKEMISIASKEGYHVLIGIDDIAKTKEMSAFLSFFGEMVLNQDNSIYLICTGLSKNIEDFASESHLSFFVRGDKIEVRALSLPQITYKYKELLNVSTEEAQKMARFTKGYAYAYQVLGELVYKNPSKDLSSVIDEFDSIIADQYEIIWASLSAAEKDLARIIVNSKTGSIEEIKGQMTNPSSYAVLRSRLIKKHLVCSSNRGELKIELPQIKEYIEMWQS